MSLFTVMKKWWLAVPALLIVAFLSLRFAGTKQSDAQVSVQHLRLDSMNLLHASGKYEDVAQRIGSLYDGYNKTKGYNCEVFVAKGSDVVFSRGYGYANYRDKKELNEHTAFRLASTSKPITATAALMLYDRGQLDLQKPVSDYLTGFPYQNITVEMLLCHRSGLPNYMYFAGDYLKGTRPSVVTNDDVLQMLVQHKPTLKFKPGTHFQYSNTNYSLLASIIEKQSGMPFGKFLQDNIFGPMQMTDSYLLTDKACTDNVACAYTYGFDPIGDDYLDGVVGDKGICASAIDLYKFHLGLERGLLLKPATKKMAYAPRSFEKAGDRNYGYGWRMKMEPNDTVIYHNGWWHGYNNVFYRRPSDSTVVIVLSNKLNMGVYKIDPLLSILDGKEQTFGSDDNENTEAKPVNAAQPVAKKSPAKKTTVHHVAAHGKSKHAVKPAPKKPVTKTSTKTATKPATKPATSKTVTKKPVTRATVAKTTTKK